MRVTFQIEYRTRWGESVHVDIQYFNSSGNVSSRQQDLSTTDGVVWRAEFTLPPSAVRMEYRYSIVSEGEVVRTEWERVPHKLHFPVGTRLLVCQDRWRDKTDNSCYFTSAFTDVFLPRERGKVQYPQGDRVLILHVYAHPLPEGCVLAVSGNQEALGNWTEGRELRMQETAPNEWAFALDANAVKGALEYKFLALDAQTGERRGWEMRDNRFIEHLHVEPGMTLLLQDESVRLPFPHWRGAGCVIPVFSIRSEGSFGIGDFGDLKLMVDWLVQTGQHILQLLPINDTTTTGHWRNSYPYNCISVFAFHPIYVDLRGLPPLKNPPTDFASLQAQLNALPQVDYEAVFRAKMEYLRLIFAQEGKRILKSKEYLDYISRNETWLLPYAAYCTLRDQHHTADFRQWGDWSTYDDSLVTRLRRKAANAKEMDFHCYVQFLLHTQLTEASRYARSHGVVLKGDIPIGISRNAVDAWMMPDHFNMDEQAGAPPDFFSTSGQNWGFPTYNWPVMMEEGCSWWKHRLTKMAEYFDAYRIDHVLGFFRIWEIPRSSVQGTLGQFSPSLPLNVEEIEGCGLPWRGDSYTNPFINDWTLNKIFGDRTAEVRHRYLEIEGNGYYSLRPDFSTQRQVQEAFATRRDDALRDGLYTLLSNVLFIEDNSHPGTYHPRIEAQRGYAYSFLSDREKDAFNRLYDDYFYHRHNRFWYDEGMRKLQLLVGATHMLPCAEDLGMVPACVAPVLEEQKILTLEIQSMPKNPQYTFGHLWENPYRSVATITTHDMPPLRAWWEEDRVISQRFYNEALHHDGPAPYPMPGWLAQQVVSLHLDSPSMLCLISFQDWLAIDERLRYPNPQAERINVPANPQQYWRYRMHLTVEQLLGETEFNQRIRRLIQTYGR